MLLLRHIRFCLLVAALIVFGAGRWVPAASRERAPGDTAEYKGFSFSAGTCEQGAEFCAVAQPRSWTPAEFALVQSALDEIAANDLGTEIIRRTRVNGFHTLRRFAGAAQAKE